jgi:CDP-diglyceride synthetase
VTRRAWAPPPLGTKRPHVRLGLLWAFLTSGAALAGAFVLGPWLAAVAGAAALQSIRQAKGKKRRRPDRAGAAAAAVLPPLGAVLGPLGALAGLVAGVTAGGLLGTARGRVLRTLAFGLPFGVAAAAPVVLRTRGLAEAGTLLALVWAFDAGDYVVGVGAGKRWEGPAAGVAGMAVVTLGAAAVLVPPFEGATAWVLGGVAVVLAPLGPVVVSALLGSPKADVPAARRLDSLVLAGPAFAAGALVLLPS